MPHSDRQVNSQTDSRSKGENDYGFDRLSTHRSSLQAGRFRSKKNPKKSVDRARKRRLLAASMADAAYKQTVYLITVKALLLMTSVPSP